MYEIEFYEDLDGHSEIAEFIKELKQKALSAKIVELILIKS